MNRMANLFSSSSPKAEEAEVDNKRTIGDTSFLDSSNNREVKRPAPDFDFAIVESTDGTFEQSVVKIMENMFYSLSEKIVLNYFNTTNTTNLLRMSMVSSQMSC